MEILLFAYFSNSDVGLETGLGVDTGLDTLLVDGLGVGRPGLGTGVGSKGLRIFALTPVDTVKKNALFQRFSFMIFHCFLMKKRF